MRDAPMRGKLARERESSAHRSLCSPLEQHGAVADVSKPRTELFPSQTNRELTKLGAESNPRTHQSRFFSFLGVTGFVTQCVLCFSVCAYARGSLRVEGTIVYSAAPLVHNAPPGSRLGARVESYFFDLRVDGRMWNIKMIPIDAPKRPITYTELGCDGEAIYAYQEQNLDLVPPKFTNGVPIVPVNQGIAQIFQDDVPSPLYYRCEALWLAYCSAGQFTTNASGMARQLWVAGDDPADGFIEKRVRAKWDWLSDDKQFLSRVEFYPEAESERSTPHALVAFNVTRTIASEGVEVPTEFTFVRFNEDDLGKKVPFVTFTCEASKVTRDIAPLVPKPKISKTVVLIDYRFRNDPVPVPHVRSHVADGVWPERSAVIASKPYEMARRVAKLDATSPEATSKRIWPILFVAANCVVLAFVVAAIRKRTKQQKEQRE